MPAEYPFFGHAQPKNLCGTANRIFGNRFGMLNVDPKKFGQRVKQRREALGMSQERLGELAGLSQSNIGWIESGGPKKPSRVASDLADHLQTTREWLLWEQGPKHVGPLYLPTPVLIEKYELLPPEKKADISQAIEKASRNDKRKKTG